MALNPKVVRAFRAMKDIGIPEEKVKPVLKNLLKVYEKNWELIEDENYRALAEAIFETEKAQEAENKKKLVDTEREVDFEEEAQVHEEPERPLKRLRLRHQDGQPSPSVSNSSPSLGGTLLKKPKVEGSDLNSENPRIESEPVSPQSLSRKKGKQPVSPNSQPSISPIRLRDRGKEPLLPQIASGEKRANCERSSNAVIIKEPKVEPGITLSPKQRVPATRALIKPKDEPVTDGIPQFEVPIAVIHPEPLSKGNSSIANGSNGESHGPEPLISQSIDAVDKNDEIAAPSIETGPSCKLAKIPDESSANLEIASSPSGEVKISLTCNSALGRPDFHMPSLDSVLKAMEDKCLRSYKVLDPKFSVTKLMKDMCECFLELGTEPNNESQETLNVTPTNDMLEKYCAVEAVGTEGTPSRPSNGSDNLQCDAEVVLPQIPRLPPPCNSVDDHVQPDKYSSADDGEIDIVLPQIPRVHLPCNSVDDHVQPDKYSSADDGEIDTVLPQLPRLPPPCNGVDDHVQPEKYSSADDGEVDIAKGQERVNISLVNEVNSDCPPSFHYIHQNVVFQNAYMSFSLARIGDDNCCLTCLGNCLLPSTPCVCAHETGGEFAYTLEGLVKEEFLEECVSMNRDPQKHCQFYCKECPLERSKNEDIIEPCKGHLMRKFIKECWWKCGCNKQCGNRVVQRGINRKLQVFMTPGGKGWGLRTLEELPKGAFVCEYVGEVLTNAELFDRVSRSPKKEDHAYPVLLDADWGSEGVLKDEEALCLDATYYGNVARFINHRCFDSNMVEIPVEVETPDHHYYHLAFFTTRKVEALEELTWDYGIDFDDHDHPVKAFRCRCGSKFCRNIKRSSRSRSSSRR